MSKRDLYLQLAPEFGGTKFGPFAGAEVRLGSEQGRNDIVLPEALGVAAEHARLVRQSDESFVLTPVDRSTVIFLYRADGRAPKPLTSPIAVGPNDGFSLVAAEGPRFIIVLELQKPTTPAEQAAKKRKAKDKLTKASFLEEVKRQGLTRALTTGTGQFLSSTWTFIKSGSFLQPRYLFTGLLLLSGWIFAGTVGCGTIGLGWKMQKDKEELAECNARARTQEAIAADGSTTASGVTNYIKLAMPKEARPALDQTFQGDSPLRALIIAEVAEVFNNREDYAWAWKTGGKKNAFLQLRTALKAQGVPAPLARPLAYSAVIPNYVEDTDYRVMLTLDDAKHCVRGPLQLSYRMGRNLGLDPLIPEAWVDPSTPADDQQAFHTALLIAQNLVPGTALEGEAKEKNVPDPSLGRCVSISEETSDDDDARVTMTKLATQLVKAIGTNAAGLPKEGQPYWIDLRLAKLYLSEIGEANFGALKWDKGEPLMRKLKVLSDQSVISESMGQQVNKRVARAYARAIAVPCIAWRAQRRGGIDKLPEAFTEDIQKDDLTTCYVLDAMAADSVLATGQ